MKTKLLVKTLVIYLFLNSLQINATTNTHIIYAEEWYRLYHQHLHRYPENEHQNLIYLENALLANFSNPLFALSRINTAAEWQVYRYLFKMHVNLQIIRTYMALADKYDRQHVYFYNAPWRKQNLESLNIAEQFYKRSYYFWNEALKWVDLLNDSSLKWIHLTDISYWHDELILIKEEKLNFEKILNKKIEHLNTNRQKFLNMDENTY